MAFAGGMAPMQAHFYPGSVYPTAAPPVAPHSQLKEVGRVRSVSPETWLWTNSTTG
jgi:hypothetical protein